MIATLAIMHPYMLPSTVLETALSQLSKRTGHDFTQLSPYWPTRQPGRHYHPAQPGTTGAVIFRRHRPQFGGEDVEVIWARPQEVHDLIGADIDNTVARLPRWARLVLPKTDGVYTVVQGLGFPFRSRVLFAGAVVPRSEWPSQRQRFHLGALTIGGGSLWLQSGRACAECETPVRDIVLWRYLAGNVLFWSVAAFGTVWALRAIWVVSKRCVRHRRGACRGCGYDLDGIDGAACPECGAQVGGRD